MDKFGIIKSKILERISESYVNGDKKKIKNILGTIIKDDNFRGLYLFYEHVENKYIEDLETAKLFVESIIPLLQNKVKNLKKSSVILSESLKDVQPSKNSVYDDLDLLSEEDTLLNIDKKIIAKLRLIEHLTKKKTVIENKSKLYTENENLLHTVLTNNFNTLYESTLSEEEKSELKSILTITSKDINDKFKVLKEEADEKVKNLLANEKNKEVIEKINIVINEIRTMDVSKYNYYKLLQLKNGL